MAAYESGDLHLAKQLLTPIALDGDLKAQKYIAYILLDANADADFDPERGVALLSDAARRGDYGALVKLETLRRDGFPYSPSLDDIIAIEINRAAAGDPVLAWRLAKRYEQGDGVVSSEREMKRWLEVAAAAPVSEFPKSGEAAYKLCVLNAGSDVDANLPAARAWCAQAAENGDAAIAVERAGQSYGAVGEFLREHLPLLRQEAFANKLRGDRLARHLAKAVDEIVSSLYALAPETDKPDGTIAICAVGGYGRRMLAPYSDIDLLILHSTDEEEKIRPLINFMLYPLWDSGMKIGYAVHSPKTASVFAKDDMIARTAYLDARFLCGSKTLFADFQNRFEKLRRRSASEFVAAKLLEQEQRQIKAGETRYLVEPDVKEGKGGLRDLQMLHWLYKYVFGGEIGASAAIDKIMDPQERRALAKAERFLWSVRAHLHDLRGRADEKLTFDVQPQIAERLGYADRTDMTAAERLMKHYFLNAVEIGRLTRVLCARLEKERTKRLPHLPKFLPKLLQKDEAPGRPNLRIRNGRLDFESAAKARRQPRDLFRLFRAFAKKPQIDFHPDALAIVAEQTPSVISVVRKDPVIARLFEGILTQTEDPVRVLRVMTETGLLGKYIPSYGSIVGRIDYGLYRRFTLDEHVLRCVGLLARICSGALESDHPLASQIIARQERPLLYFIAMLLHESVWTVKKKSLSDCEKLITRVSRRLGLSEDEAKLAGWGAARHMLLIRTAERRNLTEAHAIATFAKEVGSRERLDLILVISVCHLRIVSDRSWDEMTRKRITELYEAALAWFEGDEDALRARLAKRAAFARSAAKSRLAGWDDKKKEAFLSRLTEHMLQSVDPDILVRFAHLTDAAEKDRADAAVKVTPRDGDLEAIVYADDRKGLLADLAGAVAAAGMSVRLMQAFTTQDGKALDIFTVQSSDGAALDDMAQAGRLHGALLEAAQETLSAPPAPGRRFGDRQHIFSVNSAVRIELEASEDASVIETEGLDRPGLLYELAKAVSDLGVTITSAHIATYGERAVDAFYLCDRQGRKIADAKILGRIEKKLMSVLSAGSQK
ncbi:Bifunctional uridylyltransferase/uridylyl-removing enzyme (UTase/UR) (Bifunctional [protein-PII] modification enzyme) (Bifunctional nitrogen sensor protein) [Includes: [Protein-PII] uridylyltransferase (PII uridylyltransferase) (UTase) [Durusdinium trenchii]|uniref:Bifunctional uridylyltransferase/uridylyl-removing enzyme (UTase/UR) (Bifunctional [protein-PII] modification enzyme) (Bifunctional nitrogen sensor protein) n=1 Tax=Durusdinium trenchii TaxID=1381693 RepID=A0ABP0LJR2_9DINO